MPDKPIRVPRSQKDLDKIAARKKAEEQARIQAKAQKSLIASFGKGSIFGKIGNLLTKSAKK